MARCPFARWAPAGTPGGAIVPRVAILHTEATVGRAVPHSGLEWHFWIANDGTIYQLVDTERRADANNKANGFAISIETEDDGSPDADPWTPAQVASIVRLLRWLHTEHGIPLVRCPRWDGAGVGFHTMFGAPSEWTPVSKTCPGAARKAQFDREILPALAGDAPATEDPLSDYADQLDRIEKRLNALVPDTPRKVNPLTGELTADGVPAALVWRWLRQLVTAEKVDAAAIAAAIPEGLAEAVAVELGKRLAS